MISVALYVRYTNHIPDIQKATDYQVNQVRIQMNGQPEYEIVKIYADPHSTQETPNNGLVFNSDLHQILRDVASFKSKPKKKLGLKPFKMVVVLNYQTLSEDPFFVLWFRKQLKIHKVNLTILMKNRKSFHEELLDKYIDQFTFLSSVQQLQYLKSEAFIDLLIAKLALFDEQWLKERFQKGKVCKKQNDGFIGGTVPLGLQLINKKLEVNPEEAKIIREIVVCKNKGMTHYGIAKKLNEMGYHTKKGREFHPQTIDAIVKNQDIYQHILQSEF